ncbi:PAS domain S-box protein [Paenibacillus sp. N3.4]|uniref:PAS domain-containing protein n=1 Tax=Paenibacillus sp. N3.4 TaxID=2603222 RepID=UPI0021C42966|nr:PAS domain S-box protein [Paenibacillus sp. N3.4]
MSSAQVDEHSFFEHVHRYSPFGVAFISLDGLLVKINPALCSILGYREDELLRLSIQTFSHQDDWPKCAFQIQHITNGLSTSFSMEKRFLHKDGTIIWASVHVILIKDDTDGTPLYYLAHITDISQHKTAEKKLQESIERHTSLKKYNHDAIISLDLDGTIINGNMKAQELFGCCMSEIVGKNFFQLHRKR